MKVSGFTFVRNAVVYDYPIVEAIISILPICDEVIVAIGNSEDDTLGLIQSIQTDKIKIIETKWDDTLREGGRVLAVETDKALAAVSKDSDWAFYIQGDEVIHEKYLDNIHRAMKENLTNDKVDGLLFKYRHFYGSYDYIGSATSWYPHEIRIIKNKSHIYSYRDAQGFRKNKNNTKYPDGQKLNVKLINAFVHHYGWVKEPTAMQQKQKTFQKLWHSDEESAKRAGTAQQYKYEKNEHALERFRGTHPKVMQDRIERLNWEFNYDPKQENTSLKEHFKVFFKKYLGLDFSYRNYKLLP